MSERWLAVFGANSDMAVACARRFACEGWSIHLASRDLAALERESANLTVRFGVNTAVHYFDAREYADHETCYRSMQPEPRGVLVAFGTMSGDVPELIAVNFTGAVNVLEIVAADFEKRGTGFIVGISSVAGDRGRQSNYLYGSAKAGFTAYLSGLRQRLYPHGIDVLTVKPGFTATKMTADLDLPVAMTATPAEVADAVWRSVGKRRHVLYVKAIWRLIMLGIIHVPECIFKRLRL
jgi:decaprenylphospho-beta-D-erythro-pentofuranosid-2-ulose 2-reductase